MHQKITTTQIKIKKFSHISLLDIIMDKKNVQNGKICTTFFKIFAQKVTVLESCREFLKSFRKKLLPELKKRHYGLKFYPKILKNKMDIYINGQ